MKNNLERPVGTAPARPKRTVEFSLLRTFSNLLGSESKRLASTLTCIICIEVLVGGSEEAVAIVRRRGA